MYKLEIITCDSDRNMLEKDVIYSRNLKDLQKIVKENSSIETRNQFMYIEDTPEATRISIDIPDFHMSNQPNGGNDALEVGRIIEEDFIRDAINDYIGILEDNKEEEY